MANLVVSEESHEYPACTQSIDIWRYEDEHADLSSIRCRGTRTRRIEDLAVGLGVGPRVDVHVRGGLPSTGQQGV